MVYGPSGFTLQDTSPPGPVVVLALHAAYQGSPLGLFASTVNNASWSTSVHLLL